MSTNTPYHLGRYRLFKSLKKGGMARVFLGLDPEAPTRLLAVKTLLPKLARQRTYREMFTAEGRVARRLRHPNIVRTHDAGTHDETLYISMEYLFGFDLSTTLRRLRRQGETMPRRVAVTIARHACAGLAYAHTLTDEHGQALNIVNRDVSPGNLMICFDGAVKLIDFGIAQTTIDVKSQIGSIKGKISYMSPEQVRGLSVDRRSDVFSLGTVFYELLTGLHVFHEEGDFATMERVRRAEAPPPSHHDASIDATLDAIVARAMSREVSDRYATADALQTDLDAWLGAEGPEPPGRIAAFMRALFGHQIDQMAHDIDQARQKALVQAPVGLPSDGERPARLISEDALADLEPPAATPAPKLPASPVQPRRTAIYVGLTAAAALVGALLAWHAFG
jgi:serine/threonine protein kinase